MTKKLFFICLIGLLSINSAYAACDGGTEITIKSGTFCKSNVIMNWWSAAAWCKANGRKLATIYEICPSWDGSTGYYKCSEIEGTDDRPVWTATVSGMDYAFHLNPSYGGVNNDMGRDNTEYYSAFCK